MTAKIVEMKVAPVPVTPYKERKAQGLSQIAKAIDLLKKGLETKAFMF